jgi:archaellum component FlaC
MKSFKYIKTFESFVNEAFDLKKYFKTQKIIDDIQQVAISFVDEQTSGTELPRDVATKKDNLILWVAKTYKKELLDRTENDDFVAYLKGDVEKVNTSFKTQIEEIFEREYEQEYSIIFDYFLSLSRKNKLNIITSTYAEMYKEQEDWHNNLEVTDTEVTDESGEVLMTFHDGYYWIDLLTNNSPEEAAAMGHCGRTTANTILSLRDSNKKSHVTIAVDYLNKEEFTYKSIRQCKGKQNTKPVPRYHKYIVDLLLDDRFETTSTDKHEYRASSDFHIFDIQDKNLLIKLLSNREQLFKRLPLIFFEKNNNMDIILEAFPEILENPSALDFIYLKLHGRIDNDAEYEGFETHNSKTYYIEGVIINLIDYEKLEKDILLNEEIKDINDIKKYLKQVRLCDLAPAFVSKLIQKGKVDILSSTLVVDKVYLYKNKFIEELNDDNILELNGGFYKMEDMGYPDVYVYKFYELLSGYKWDIITTDEFENYDLKSLVEKFPDFLETSDPEDAEYLYKNNFIDLETFEGVTKLYEEFKSENKQRYALFNFLVDEGHISNIKGSLFAIEQCEYDSDEFKCPEDGTDYLVLNDDVATERAIEYNVELFKECGAPDNLITQFVDDKAILEWIKDDYDDTVRDDPENWDIDKEFTEAGQEALDNANDRLGIAQRRLDEYQELLEEKQEIFNNMNEDSDNYTALEEEIEEIEETIEELESTISDIESEIEEIEDEDGQYYEITEEAIEDKIESLTDEYRHNPIERIEEMYFDRDELFKFLESQGWIDLEEMAEWCVEQDGRGPVLNSYDGYEEETTIEIDGESITYYIYRRS